MEKPMPKSNAAITKKGATETAHAVPAKHKVHHTTFESTAYLGGLFEEFQEQAHKYQTMTGDLLALEARVELLEKTMCLTRDHLAMMVGKTQDAIPHDWSKTLNSVRFAGVRLIDACAKSLQEHKKMTPEELLRELNNGMFRFRTNSPLREIHAALLRHPDVKRVGRVYVWTAPVEQQIPMRLRVSTVILKQREPNREEASTDSKA
jgi:hypothetical protein